jgi:hypothetical protein
MRSRNTCHAHVGANAAPGTSGHHAGCAPAPQETEAVRHRVELQVNRLT